MRSGKPFVTALLLLYVQALPGALAFPVQAIPPHPPRYSVSEISGRSSSEHSVGAEKWHLWHLVALHFPHLHECPLKPRQATVFREVALLALLAPIESVWRASAMELFLALQAERNRSPLLVSNCRYSCQCIYRIATVLRGTWVKHFLSMLVITVSRNERRKLRLCHC